MKSTRILAFLILMIIRPAFSQSGIQGRVYDVDSNGIAFANVLLLNKEDTLLIRGAVTDENGNFHIGDLRTGTYRIESSMIGYSKTVLPTVNLTNPGNLVLGPIILQEDLNELEEVLVKASKPLYEVEMGKMVINVQSSITSAGLSAIDVLERSPGVYVNRQENSISVGGKDGVAVLMNGKRSRMPMEALYQMLAGLNAADIEKIEIITVPPAGYDSDGDAGFVNIVMKRNSGTLGTGATLATGLGYGSGPQANFSLNLNHQGKKLNWFGSYSLHYLDHLAEWESYRESNNGWETVLTSNMADRTHKRTAHNYQFGVDFLISERLIVSGLVSGYDNKIRIAAPTLAFIDYSISTDTLIESSIDEIRHWKHGMGNVNLQYTFKNRQC